MVVICILQFIKSEIKKINPFSFDIILTFEDIEISKKQYLFLKEHLNNYDWFLDDEYSMTSETIYNESSRMLLIALDIIIPNHLMPKDEKNLTRMIKDHINKFPKFYKQNMEFYNPEAEQKLKTNPYNIP